MRISFTRRQVAKHQTPYIVPIFCLSNKARQDPEGHLGISAELHRKQISRCNLLSAGSWLMGHDECLFVGVDRF